jgi:hypothetical protein
MCIRHNDIPADAGRHETPIATIDRVLGEIHGLVPFYSTEHRPKHQQEKQGWTGSNSTNGLDEASKLSHSESRRQMSPSIQAHFDLDPSSSPDNMQEGGVQTGKRREDKKQYLRMQRAEFVRPFLLYAI